MDIIIFVDFMYSKKIDCTIKLTPLKTMLHYASQRISTPNILILSAYDMAYAVYTIYNDVVQYIYRYFMHIFRMRAPTTGTEH